MKILAIGAHFDDVELGCGGALAKWRNDGHAITVFVLTKSGYNDERGNVIRSDEAAFTEGSLAANVLGAKLIISNFQTFSLEFGEALNKEVLNAIKAESPDIILTHWSEDVHHDHRALALSTLHCARQHPRLLMYSSNWYSSPVNFDPRLFINITDTIETKIRLIELHKSENDRTNGHWIEFCRSQANVYGRKLGVKYAEGFQVVRWLETKL